MFLDPESAIFHDWFLMTIANVMTCFYRSTVIMRLFDSAQHNFNIVLFALKLYPEKSSIWNLPKALRTSQTIQVMCCILLQEV